MTEYYANAIAQMKASLPEEEFAKAKASVEQEFKLFNNTWAQFLIMCATVLLMGLIASSISAIILSTKTNKPITVRNQ